LGGAGVASAGGASWAGRRRSGLHHYLHDLILFVLIVLKFIELGI
jgi:hypothetical protein